jgi:EAL domain-containing protein (putative c-di-GMP-specific phosphodiesterase class I)
LTLELTESTLLHATGFTLELLAKIEALGVRIAIDDFGTGYSSFAYLHQYPLDRLKIDRSFIQGLADRSTARSIVTAMIELGHHLGLKVVAEGVETEEQRAILDELRCDLFQGFLKSPAIRAADVVEMAASS